MLRLTLDLVPGGDEPRACTLGMIELWRTTAREDPETYRMAVYTAEGELVNLLSVGPHAYRDGAWELVKRALAHLGPPE